MFGRGVNSLGSVSAEVERLVCPAMEGHKRSVAQKAGWRMALAGKLLFPKVLRRYGEAGVTAKPRHYCQGNLVPKGILALKSWCKKISYRPATKPQWLVGHRLANNLGLSL
jgi:hypothetical protein